MKQKNYRPTLLATSILGVFLGGPALAQEAEPVSQADIVVTARRVEERLQDVPISITVLNQEQLSNANVTNAADLAATTPGLVANQRFGADNSSFTIRGFTQELRTTASVGVYFADVISPRGATPTTSGDGAGPGAFFDLQNVQVLKGPQGTLFGRNTTGGAVLLVPQRPTDEFGGYVEGSVGNYDMQRLQGVLNAPINDDARFRIGVDVQSRDGYLRNISDVGPDRFSDVNYATGRASLVLDVAPNIENYTIVSYTHSENNGNVSQMFACNPAPSSPLAAFNAIMCPASVPNPRHDFYDVQNSVVNPVSEITQWQFINTTTWDVSDNLTVKNILSYANLETTLRGNVTGADFNFQAVTPLAPDLPYVLFNSGTFGSLPSVDQDSMVEELQFQGTNFGDRLSWQAGLYYEKSEPAGPQAAQSVANIQCDMSTVSGDPSNALCWDAGYAVTHSSFFQGTLLHVTGSTQFENKAAYAQATYHFDDHWAVTGGIRYTWDKTEGEVRSVRYLGFPSTFPAVPGPPTAMACSDPTPTVTLANGCLVTAEQDSEAPTWLLDLDYKPTDDILIYAKWGRGYRQGGVNISSVAGGYTYEPEHVDTYELGAKTTFDGPVPGTFNIAAFYNDFRDQQIQLGLFPIGGGGTTAIVNVGASTIYGLELDLSLELFKGFTLSGSYSYLNSNFDEVEDPVLASDPACGGFPSFRGTCVLGATTAATEGQPTTFSPENQFSITAAYRLPVSENVGNITASATYSYSDEYLAVMPASSPYATIPNYETVNLNLNWQAIGGSNVDAALFATNVFDEEYYTFIGGQYNSSAIEYRQLGQPRMFGARLRYRFGQ